MPRIRTLKIDHPYYGEREFTIVRSAHLDIAEALELEHDCEDNTCDIGAAMAHSHYLAAAFLLTGATDELHYLEPVLKAHAFNGTLPDLLEAFDAWCASDASTPAWTCESCDASVYDADDTRCNCCGWVRPDDDDDDDDEHPFVTDIRQAELWGSAFGPAE